MDWMNQLSGVLQQYTGAAAAPLEVMLGWDSLIQIQ